MLLSEIVGYGDVEIYCDGEFKSLGLLSHKMDKMLVCFYDERYLSILESNPKISSVVTSPSLVNKLPKHLSILVGKNPLAAFYQIHKNIQMNTKFYWKDFDSKIAPNAIIHPSTYVAKKNVQIGSNVVIEPNATIMERSIIEENSIIRAGCVIGTEGFEFKKLDGKSWSYIPHAGGVYIDKDVEIQSQSCVDKAVFGGFTKIGENTKIDKLVHVGHNVVIGKRCLIAAQAMIAGSVDIGDDVWLGPSCSISDGLNIGDRAAVSLGAVVTKDVLADTRVSGNFAIEHQKFIQFIKKASMQEKN